LKSLTTKTHGEPGMLVEEGVSGKGSGEEMKEEEVRIAGRKLPSAPPTE